ncbi:hypothetical protein [Hydrogenophaga sp.]|uniref:hypothetical protein n=1 Tax=Hydrogenophaga sp. TaxID=1904254 RepID=UPI0026395742|nr:hypothetical protein [Hydrogenophaga sp.]
MKYQTYIAAFGTERAGDLPDQVMRGPWTHAIEGSVDDLMAALGSKKEAQGETLTFVVVSRDTLARLGVLDKIGTCVLGASLPSFMTADHPKKARWFATKQYSPSVPPPLGKGIFHFGGQSTSRSVSSAPLVLEVEDALFAAGELAAHTTLSDISVDTFSRLQAMLGDVVAQASTSPEVIAPEDDRFELLEAKDFAARLDATDQTVYNWEKAGRLISVLPPGRVRSRRYPAFQLSPRLNRPLHALAIAMYRSHEQDMTLYWDFLRTRHKDFGGSTGVDFLLNRVAEPGLVDLEESDLHDLFLSMAEEDMSRAIS